VYVFRKIYRFWECTDGVEDEEKKDMAKVFYSPTDAQVNCLKNNFKI
jgi:hypothetical protein